MSATVPPESSDFLSRLVDRVLGRDTVIEPRLPGRFESASAAEDESPAVAHHVGFAQARTDPAAVEIRVQRQAVDAEPSESRTSPAQISTRRSLDAVEELRPAMPELASAPAQERAHSNERIVVPPMPAGPQPTVIAAPRAAENKVSTREYAGPPAAERIPMHRRFDERAAPVLEATPHSRPRAGSLVPEQTPVLAALESRAREKDPALSPAPNPEPIVNISIGRIEIRAQTPLQTATAPIRRPEPMTLQAYLERRGSSR